MNTGKPKTVNATYQGHIKNHKTSLKHDPRVADLLGVNAQFFNDNNINITKKVNDFETLIATSRSEAEEIAEQKRSYVYQVNVHIKNSRSPAFVWYGIPN